MPLVAGFIYRTPWTRPRRIAELLLILWAIGMSDLWLTLSSLGDERFIERNPVARFVLHQHADSGLIVFKIACMMMATLALWHIRHTRRCELAVWTMTGVYFLLMFQWNHYTRVALNQ